LKPVYDSFFIFQIEGRKKDLDSVALSWIKRCPKLNFIFENKNGKFRAFFRNELFDTVQSEVAFTLPTIKAKILVKMPETATATVLALAT